MFWAMVSIEPKSSLVAILGYQLDTPGKGEPQLRTGMSVGHLLDC